MSVQAHYNFSNNLRDPVEFNGVASYFGTWGRARGGEAIVLSTEEGR